jgi:hypothetical protein
MLYNGGKHFPVILLQMRYQYAAYKDYLLYLAKIISLFEKTPPLSPLMLTALRKAYEMQDRNEPFGQIDIDGSFFGLLRRGFIDARTIIVKGEILFSWFVTSAGKYALINFGFSEDAENVSY